MVPEDSLEGFAGTSTHDEYANPWTSFEVYVPWIGDDLMPLIGLVEIDLMLKIEQHNQDRSFRDEFCQDRLETTP